MGRRILGSGLGGVQRGFVREWSWNGSAFVCAAYVTCCGGHELVRGRYAFPFWRVAWAGIPCAGQGLRTPDAGGPGVAGLPSKVRGYNTPAARWWRGKPKAETGIGARDWEMTHATLGDGKRTSISGAQGVLGPLAGGTVRPNKRPIHGKEKGARRR